MLAERREAGRRRRETASVVILLVPLFAIVLCAALLLNVEDGVFGVAGAGGRRLNKESHNHLKEAKRSHDFSVYSCEEMSDLPEKMLLSHDVVCDFARTCNEGDGLFVPLVYCHPTLPPHTIFLLLSLPLTVLLVVLFRILGSTAEEYFTPGLETLSLRLGLPERFAGVTLLALGNGAPDVASTVNAITNDRKRGYLMALGELTGAAMVSSTVIAGAVCYVAGGVPCRGAMIRDIVVFILAMSYVYKSFDDGTVSVTEVRTFVSIYAAYAIVVLGSDLYHLKVVEPRIGSLDSAERMRFAEENDVNKEQVALGGAGSTENVVGSVWGGHAAGREQAAAASEGTPLVAALRPSKQHRSSSLPVPIEGVIEAISNYDDVALSTSEHPVVDIESWGANRGDRRCRLKAERSASESVIVFFSDVERRRLIRQNSSSPTGWAARDSDGTEPLVVFHRGDLCFSPSASEKRSDSGAGTPKGWGDALSSGWQELVDQISKQLWEDSLGSADYGLPEKFLLLCEMPFTVLRMLTIPVPSDGYYCRPLVALSLALSPLWMRYYLWNQFGKDLIGGSTKPALAAILVLPVAAGIAVLRYAPRGDGPMPAAAAVPLVLVGFAASATWLDLIADRLVCLLSFFGVVFRIPATIMGLTVLAWGNASQDFAANMTVARKGLSTMAITASFAGPAFNVLVGLGLGFAILMDTEGSAGGVPVPVRLNDPIRVGFAFSILNGLLVLVGGICVGRGTIHSRYGYVALAIYAAYALVSLTVQIPEQ